MKAITDGKARDPDEVIEGGRDVAWRPSSTARFAYRAAARGEGKAAQDMRGQVFRHVDQLEEWPAFVREVFARLYDENGCHELPDEERGAWAISAMAALEEQECWSSLRESAQVSRTLAAAAAARLADAVSSAMGLDRIPTDEQSRRDPREVMDEARSIARLLSQHGAGQEAIDEVMEQAAEAAAKAVAVRRALDRAVGAGRPRLSRVVGAVAADVQRRAQAVQALAGLGFSREGPGSVEEAAPELLEAVMADPRLAQILRWAGRFREAASGEMARADGRCDVVGVLPTGDIARLTPRTRGDLATGGARSLATMRDILEGAAQGWEQRDMAPKVRGDVGILVDRSGSMSGEREARARGLAVAALVTSVQQGRRAVACSFAGQGDANVVGVVPGDVKALAGAVGVLCMRAGGGTDVDGAIGATVERMALFQGGLRDPDLLVITDGYFPAVAADVLSRLGERRLFGVFLDCAGTEAHPEFDAGWDLSGPVDEATAGQIIAAMRKPRAKKRRAS